MVGKDLFRDIVEKLPIPVVVGTADYKTEYTNPKFLEVFGYTAEEIPDQRTWREKFFPDPAYREKISHDVDEWIGKEGKGDEVAFERIYTDKWGREHNIIVQLFKLKDRYYNIFFDITERRQAEKAREKSIKELQTALDEVKKLRGIIPICAHCKKIRNDKGAWDQIEKYISERSDAQFSHGICPDCTRKLYPNLEIRE